eukprot:2235256-Heterocapsa_arctica.AAC.1
MSSRRSTRCGTRRSAAGTGASRPGARARAEWPRCTSRACHTGQVGPRVPGKPREAADLRP